MPVTRTRARPGLDEKDRSGRHDAWSTAQLGQEHAAALGELPIATVCGLPRGDPMIDGASLAQYQYTIGEPDRFVAAMD